MMYRSLVLAFAAISACSAVRQPLESADTVVPMQGDCQLQQQTRLQQTRWSVAVRLAEAAVNISGPSAEAQISALWKMPAPPSQPYQLEHPNKEWYGQDRQDARLMEVFSGIKHGFFVESGAFDGEMNSNTLLYEMKKSWAGLLVEPAPSNFAMLQKKHRRSHLFNGALSLSGEIETAQFQDLDCDGWGNECGSVKQKQNANTYPVLCVPLHQLLARIGVHTVDFWSLDIEGSEGAVLLATDFKNIEVGVLLIEMNKNDDNNKTIEGVMAKNGFKEVGRTAFDRIYINPHYFTKRGLTPPEHA
mmetsp:Transcript_123399/g.240119  ORF Transcript_123399/g.240119 Transcript_123399/m.240119 type:complete len:303 (-) Transcript_123399:75-983(-)